MPKVAMLVPRVVATMQEDKVDKGALKEKPSDVPLMLRRSVTRDAVVSFIA